MTRCLISGFFLGTSAAQVVAADDVVTQCPTGVSESVCHPDRTSIQQHIEIGVVASGRRNGKMSGKRVLLRMHGTIKYNIQAYNTVLLF